MDNHPEELQELLDRGREEQVNFEDEPFDSPKSKDSDGFDKIDDDNESKSSQDLKQRATSSGKTTTGTTSSQPVKTVAKSPIPNTNLYDAYNECVRIQNDVSRTGFVQGQNVQR